MKRILILLTMLLVVTGLTSIMAQEGGDEPRVSKKVKTIIRGGWLGVEVENITDDLRKEKDVAVNEGAYVRDVVKESPADSAGVKQGDVIVEFSGKKIAGPEALVKIVRAVEAGTRVPLVIMRGKEKKTLHVTVGQAKDRQLEVMALAKPRISGLKKTPGILQWFGSEEGATYGLTLETLNDQLAEYFGAPEKKGVLVKAVKKDSRADKAGFQAGDVIIKAGKKTVRKVQDFKHVLGAFDPGEKINVDVLRKGIKKTLSLEAVESKGSSLDLRMDPKRFSFKYRIDEDGVDQYRQSMEHYKDAMERYRDLDDDGIIDIDIDLDGLKSDLEDVRVDVREMMDQLREHQPNTGTRMTIEKKVKKETKDI